MQEIQDLKEQRIIKEASSVFWHYGLRSTSMDDLACKLKISKKSLYKYFDNKSDLVKSVLEYREAERLSKIRELSLDHYDTLMLGYIKMMLFARLCFKNTLKNYYDIKKYYPELYNDFIRGRETLIQAQMNAFVQKGITEGVFHEGGNDKAKQAIFIRFLNDLYEKDDILQHFPFEELMTSVFDIYIRSMATTKGLEHWEKLLRDKPQTALIEEIIQQHQQLDTKQ